MVASVQSGVSIHTAAPLPVRPPAGALAPVSRAVPAPVDQLQTSLPSGRVPAQPLKLFSDFDPIAAGKRNTTAQVSKAHRPASLKAALEPTFQIVEAVDPKTARALRQMRESDFEMAADGMHDMFAKHDIYAAWVTVAREKGTARLHFSDMILDDRFWKLRDAEKASVLIHEMVHAGDTPIISNFEKLFGTIANKVKGVEWGDPVEDRAYLHQAAINQKLGLGEGDEIYWTVRTYLEDRGLWPVPHRTK
jgi:hypothetical protein